MHLYFIYFPPELCQQITIMLSRRKMLLQEIQLCRASLQGPATCMQCAHSYTHANKSVHAQTQTMTAAEVSLS